jgi:glycosyltransferase involved in cell wall biosynthesis
VPSGIFGLAGKIAQNIKYDVWVLGSDIWKIRTIPLLGKMLLKIILKNAGRVFADGIHLCEEVKDLTGVPCEFLASSRRLPPPQKKTIPSVTPGVKHFLFVGRYHTNKGPDLLIKAVDRLPVEMKESIRVHMFGLGPMETDLKDMISELHLHKYIALNGPIRSQEFSNYLDIVSFLVIPSRIESIPVVFSDAIQTGTPVVSMPVGDLTDLITKFNCGIIAAEVSAEALSSAIAKAATTSKDYFKEGVQNACKHFEIGNSVERWLKVN